jgi:hypothetical protein
MIGVHSVFNSIVPVFEKTARSQSTALGGPGYVCQEKSSFSVQSMCAFINGP